MKKGQPRYNFHGCHLRTSFPASCVVLPLFVHSHAQALLASAEKPWRDTRRSGRYGDIHEVYHIYPHSMTNFIIFMGKLWGNYGESEIFQGDTAEVCNAEWLILEVPTRMKNLKTLWNHPTWWLQTANYFLWEIRNQSRNDGIVHCQAIPKSLPCSFHPDRNDTCFLAKKKIKTVLLYKISAVTILIFAYHSTIITWYFYIIFSIHVL